MFALGTVGVRRSDVCRLESDPYMKRRNEAARGHRVGACQMNQGGNGWENDGTQLSQQYSFRFLRIEKNMKLLL